jgi:hypothetical protein
MVSSSGHPIVRFWTPLTLAALPEEMLLLSRVLHQPQSSSTAARQHILRIFRSRPSPPPAQVGALDPLVRQ